MRNFVMANRALLVLLMGFGLSACDGGGDSTSTDPTTTTTTPAVDPDPVVKVPTTAPSVTMIVAPKQLKFSWPAVTDADHYRILENPDGGSGFTEIAKVQTTSYDHEISTHLTDWIDAQYQVEACDAAETSCVGSTNQTLTKSDSVSAIGSLTASNPDLLDSWGYQVKISRDGSTLAVSSLGEASSTQGINGSEDDDKAPNAGAVYIFTKNGSGWVQQVYLKGSNTEMGDYFGYGVSLSSDGNTLAVGAGSEDSASNLESDNKAINAGAVYIFTRSGSTWMQQAYLKSSYPTAGSLFGAKVVLSADGNTLLTSAESENSGASGVNGSLGQLDVTKPNSGAAYIFTRNGTFWSPQAYLKASNPGSSDRFGDNLSLSADGNTAAISAGFESSSSTGINGDQVNNAASRSGAVYVFSRSAGNWVQEAYIKTSNPNANDELGDVSLSDDGNVLAVGAKYESSSYKGVNRGSAAELDNRAPRSGAAYLFTRSGGGWSQEAYIKASNTNFHDWFGHRVSLSGDGLTLAVGAPHEDSSSEGVNANESDDTVTDSGAVYLFKKSSTGWVQKSYLKSSNTTTTSSFGSAVNLNPDGSSLMVSAPGENGSTGVVYLY